MSKSPIYNSTQWVTEVGGIVYDGGVARSPGGFEVNADNKLNAFGLAATGILMKAAVTYPMAIGHVDIFGVDTLSFNINSTVAAFSFDMGGDVIGMAGGFLSLPAEPTADSHAVTKKYVDDNSGKWDDATGGISYTGGNVGIGTDTPTELLNLEIPSALNNSSNPMVLFNIGNGSGSAQISYVRGSSGTEGGLAFDASTGAVLSEAMRINASGNVGIGTDAPVRKLHIDGGTDSTVMGLYGDTSVLVDFRANAGAGGRTAYIQSASNGSLNLANEGGAQITFRNGGAERMRIDTSGLVTAAGGFKVNTDNQINAFGVSGTGLVLKAAVSNTIAIGQVDLLGVDTLDFNINNAAQSYRFWTGSANVISMSAGFMSLPLTPTADSHAVRKDYVDDRLKYHLPEAVGRISSTGGMNSVSGIASVSKGATGFYDITLSETIPTADQIIQITTTSGAICGGALSISNSVIRVTLINVISHVYQDDRFYISVWNGP